MRSDSVGVHTEQTALIKCMYMDDIWPADLFSPFTNPDKNSQKGLHFHTPSVKAKGFCCIL